jgi:hypothetical protein
MDPTATVPGDAPCRKCSYNLRGLTYGGRCPECGTPVGLSIHGDLLRYSDPEWLLKLARGLSFILWGILVAIVVGIVGGFVSNDPALHHWLGIFGGAMGFYGAWLLTEPDPSGLGEAQYATSRKLVRVALAVGLGGSLLEALTATLQVPQEASGMFALVAVLAGIVAVVGEFAKFIYLEKLARRIPDEALARRARVLRWGYGMTLAVLAVVGAAVTLLAARGNRGAALGGAACLVLPIVIAYIVFAVMTLFFYIKMRKALFIQNATARVVWSSAAISLA